MDERFDPNATPRGIDDPGTAATGPTRMIPALAVVRITPAHWNPRKVYDPAQTETLAADVRVRGILEPLVVRPRERDGVEGYEIVCGERRYRAAMLAGLLHVPAVVRELGDREALECAVSENGQRESLHPLEEADAFITLHVTYNESAEDIAARFGVTVRLVHQRLSLAALCQEGRDAFREGVLSWGSALRIARLSSQDYQREAVEWARTTRAVRMAQGSETGVAAAEVGRWIESRYHLRLDRAPFDVADGELLAGVGGCGTCPKNTDRQRALFEEELGFAECTDPVCFSRKKEAAWQREAAAYAVAQGREGAVVLTAEASASVAPAWPGALPSGGYVEPDAKPLEHGGKRTWTQLLGVHMPPTVVVRGRDGQPVELIEPSALKAACAAAGLKKLTKAAKAKPFDGVTRTLPGPRWYHADFYERHIDSAAWAAASKLKGQGMWTFVARLVRAQRDPFDVDQALKRMGVPIARGKDAFGVWAVGASATDVMRFLMLLAVSSARECEEPVSDEVAAVLFGLGVDVKKILADSEATKPAPKGKAPAKPAAKKSAKKGGR
jgi:ParB/RepB/Spo0J family partition protein